MQNINGQYFLKALLKVSGNNLIKAINFHLPQFLDEFNLLSEKDTSQNTLSIPDNILLAFLYFKPKNLYQLDMSKSHLNNVKVEDITLDGVLDMFDMQLVALTKQNRQYQYTLSIDDKYQYINALLTTMDVEHHNTALANLLNNWIAKINSIVTSDIMSLLAYPVDIESKFEDFVEKLTESYREQASINYATFIPLSNRKEEDGPEEACPLSVAYYN